MYKPKTITLEATIGQEIFKYELLLRGPLTGLVGDSGTGKSILCEVARRCREKYKKQYGSCIRVYDYVNYDTLNDFLIARPEEAKDWLIIIDNGDDFLTNKQLQVISRDHKNYYIVIRRTTNGIPASPNYFAELYQDKDGIYRLHYDCSVPRWFS